MVVIGENSVGISVGDPARGHDIHREEVAENNTFTVVGGKMKLCDGAFGFRCID